MMKKVLILPVLLASIFTFSVSSAQAAENKSVGATASVANAPQIVQYRRNNRGRVVRTYTTTRLERRGNRVFRVTYQVTQRPNGRTTSRMISRTRVR
jgi:hypothetical protein